MTDKLEQSSDAHSMQSTEQQEKKDALATSSTSGETEYPPFKKVLAIVLGMMSVSLLVALVSIVPILPPFCRTPRLTRHRIEPSSQQQYPPSRTISTRSAM